MPKFKVPVVFKVEAKTKKEAENSVASLMCERFHVVRDGDPKLFDAIEWWNFAEIRSRKGGK